MNPLAEKLVGEEEGLSPTAYPDSRGFITIAIGCLVDKRIPGSGLCQAAIDAQFAHDSAQAAKDAALYPGYFQMNEVRQAVIFSMSFQMGTKPLHWPNFDAAIAACDWKAARVAGLDSEWAREETPKRAQREMYMLFSGAWLNHGDPIPEYQ